MNTSLSIPAELTDRLLSLTDAPEGTAVIGVAGAPGVGKSTLVEALLREVNGAGDVETHRVAHVPMDGFHLSDRELGRLGLLQCKGAPDTFDARGYAALLARLAAGHRAGVVYAPGFERTLEQPVAGDIPVFPAARAVLTEGNYLLLDRPEWQQVRAACTEVWYVEADEQTRKRQLLERHVRYGKADAAAEAWVQDVDEPNARLVLDSRDGADLVLRITGNQVVVR